MEEESKTNKKGTIMFVTIIVVNGFKNYYGPFATRQEARECQMVKKAEAKEYGTEVFSEVVELQKF